MASNAKGACSTDEGEGPTQQTLPSGVVLGAGLRNRHHSAGDVGVMISNELHTTYSTSTVLDPVRSLESSATYDGSTDQSRDSRDVVEAESSRFLPESEVREG